MILVDGFSTEDFEDDIETANKFFEKYGFSSDESNQLVGCDGVEVWYIGENLLTKDSNSPNVYIFRITEKEEDSPVSKWAVMGLSKMEKKYIDKKLERLNELLMETYEIQEELKEPVVTSID